MKKAAGSDDDTEEEKTPPRQEDVKVRFVFTGDKRLTLAIERVFVTSYFPHPLQDAAINEAMRTLSEFFGATAKAEAVKKQIVELAAMAKELPDVSMAEMAPKLAKYVAEAKKLEAMCRDLKA